MKIAICDDDSLDMGIVKSILIDYQKENRLRYEYKCFSNAIELLEVMKSESFDIFFGYFNARNQWNKGCL